MLPEKCPAAEASDGPVVDMPSSSLATNLNILFLRIRLKLNLVEVGYFLRELMTETIIYQLQIWNKQCKLKWYWKMNPRF